MQTSFDFGDPIAVVLVTALGALLLVLCVWALIREHRRRSKMTQEQREREDWDEQFGDAW